MKLVFDGNSLVNDAINILRDTLNKVNLNFYTKAGEPDSKIEEAKLTGTEIEAVCEFYANAIMDSFGTGSAMDRGNKFWDDYMASGMYNPLRSGKLGGAILGRKAGTYINIFGESATSSGRFVGKDDVAQDLEGRIKPRNPTRKIQNAENFIFNDGHHLLEQEVDRALEQWLSANFSKYFRTI